MHKESIMNIAYTYLVEIILKNNTYNSVSTQYLDDYKISGFTHHIL